MPPKVYRLQTRPHAGVHSLPLDLGAQPLPDGLYDQLFDYLAWNTGAASDLPSGEAVDYLLQTLSRSWWQSASRWRQR